MDNEKFTEFLMTYGWAILVVLAAIGALAYFDVLSHKEVSTTYKFADGTIDRCAVESCWHSACDYKECDSGNEYKNQVNVKVINDG